MGKKYGTKKESFVFLYSSYWANGTIEHKKTQNFDEKKLAFLHRLMAKLKINFKLKLGFK